MKNALISPDEKVHSYTGELLGERIAEVSDTAFEVAQPLFWTECGDEVVADLWYWTGTACAEIPLPPVADQTAPIASIPNGPNIVA